MTGTLVLVGTPIGNLEDAGERARRVLAEVDVIAAEDTRRTGMLLQSLGVTRRARMVSFFEGNESARVPSLIRALEEGRSVALVTDGGMPSVSDPGYRLVAACVDAGITVDVVPGPSAAVAALVVSGLPTDRWSFEGFLPRSGRSRRERLAEIAADPRTIVMFESAKRLEGTLADLRAIAGDRRVAVARELTKLHQEIIRGPISEVLSSLRERETVRGELVVVMEGAARGTPDSADDGLAIARRLLAEGHAKRAAARRASAATGTPANEIYRRLVEPGS
jgi:16S rRNA (cytidine1402-2'-O)-methyltransferase